MIKKRFSIVERKEIVEKCSQCLWTKAGKLGLEYLISTRNLSENTLKDFKLGYMPSFVDHQLKGRVIFPLLDPTGNLISVGSRRIRDDQPSELPVYWHESYEKSYYLYGVYNAKNAVLASKYTILVEGQFDVLQMHNAGIKNVMALCGTNFSEVQRSVINRYCDEIVLLMDRDKNQAGQAASKKIMNKFGQHTQLWGTSKRFPNIMKSFQQSSTLYRKMIVVELPVESDPDEFIKSHGSKSLRDLIEGKINELRNRNPVGC